MAYYIATVTKRSTGKLKAVLTTESNLKSQKMMQYQVRGEKRKEKKSHHKKNTPNQTLKLSQCLFFFFPSK